MAKNITIREGDTAKQFTAKKLKTNLVGGGTTNWVPEDEAIDYVRLVDREFKANGTYNPGDFNADGFGQVKVNIPADVKEKTITANGEFYAADDHCMGYNKVIVAVPGGGGGGPFTVRFFDDDRQTILKTDANVPYGGSASCTLLDGTVIGGEYFKGWNPSPTNVKENMNCYPVRGEYSIDANEIQDSWETICADGGEHYPLGSYKSLIFDIPIENDFYPEIKNVFDFQTGQRSDGSRTGTSVSAMEVRLHMVKVAEAEDGSTSSWLSSGVIPICSATHGESWSDIPWTVDNTSQNIWLDWASSPERKYLNENLLSQMPLALQSAIKQVTKYYYGQANFPAKQNVSLRTLQLVEKSILDRIWIPSNKELLTFINTNGINQYGYLHIEDRGIDYTSVYMPSYQNSMPNGRAFRTRTISQLAFNGNYGIYADGAYYNYGWTFYSRINGHYAPFGFCL